MKISRTVRTLVVAMTCFGFLSADVARAAGPAIAKVRDVALQSAGVLHGQVVDAQVAPQAQAGGCRPERQSASVAQTDAAGRFTLANMSGGVYELQTASNTDVYRLWRRARLRPLLRTACCWWTTRTSCSANSGTVLWAGWPIHGSWPVSWPLQSPFRWRWQMMMMMTRVERDFLR